MDGLQDAKFTLTNLTEAHSLLVNLIQINDPIVWISSKMASYTVPADDPIADIAIADNETILQIINNSRTFPEQAQLQTCEPDRSQITNHLKYLTENVWYKDYRARTWGYTIIRTAYRDGDDEKFKHGIDMIHRFLRLWSDTELQSATEQIQAHRAFGRRMSSDFTGQRECQRRQTRYQMKFS